jgi:hypothetical protein
MIRIKKTENVVDENGKEVTSFAGACKALNLRVEIDKKKLETKTSKSSGKKYRQIGISVSIENPAEKCDILRPFLANAIAFVNLMIFSNNSVMVNVTKSESVDGADAKTYLGVKSMFAVQADNGGGSDVKIAMVPFGAKQRETLNASAESDGDKIANGLLLPVFEFTDTYNVNALNELVAMWCIENKLITQEQYDARWEKKTTSGSRTRKSSSKKIVRSNSKSVTKVDKTVDVQKDEDIPL